MTSNRRGRTLTLTPTLFTIRIESSMSWLSADSGARMTRWTSRSITASRSS